MTKVGWIILVLMTLGAAAAPMVAPHDPAEDFRAYIDAPPMRPHVIDDDGGGHLPFVYPLRLVSRLEQRYDEDRTRRVPLVVGLRGRVLSAADESTGPWLPLGADREGHDVFSRMIFAARTSMGVSVLATLFAVVFGTLVGGVAGYAGGRIDAVLMRAAEFVTVLPVVYVVLALRSALPLVLPPWTVFLMMTGIFAMASWPWVARAVRSVVATERTKDYAAAAEAIGGTHSRILFVHLLPAAKGVVAAQAVLLLPACILAEATLSYVGLGFPDTLPSWGSMLQQASEVSAMAEFPWLLAPAAGIFLVTFGANLVLQHRGQA
jgi:peptide/nickel transport system permease protein